MATSKAFMLKFLLFLLGFIAMSVQILVIREALAIFSGNELVIGLCLGAWMLLTALGSYFGSILRFPGAASPEPRDRRFSAGIIAVLVMMASMPFFITWIMVFLKSHLLPTGALAGVTHITMILAITMAPFCLLSGMLFPVLTGRLSRLQDRNLIHQAYALDSAGSILGGIIFSLGIFLLPQAAGFKLQGSRVDELLYPGQQVMESRNTPFGKLTLTKLDDQFILYENGDPVLLTGDAAQREEPVHYAMLLHPRPERVLMISGGVGGSIEEVFKYPDVQVDYVEINPWMIALVDKYVPFPVNDRLRIISQDPRIYLDQSDGQYDVILLNTPDPGSAELNRFYTQEFFTLIKERLASGGIVSLSTRAAGNYMNESSRMLHSVIYATLSTSFTHIRIIPGTRDYFLASDRELDRSLWSNPDKPGKANLYVNPGYIEEDLMNERADLISREISTGVKTNSDLRPFVYLQTYRQWLDQFRFDYRIIPAVLVILVILAFIFLGPLNLGLFAGGFTTSATEFLLILWFQVLYGVVYQVTGVIFAVFMAGMATGAMMIPQLFKTVTIKEFRNFQVLFIVFPLLLAPAMLFLPGAASPLVKITTILVFIGLSGILMGGLFSLSGMIRKGAITKGAGEAFSADLLGSAAGILLVSAYLVPVVGLPLTCLMIAGLNVVVVMKSVWVRVGL